MAKRVKEPETEIIKAVDPFLRRTATSDSSTGSAIFIFPSGSWTICPSFFEVVLKLVSWIIILTVIGGGLYFGLPLLYQRYVVPVQENTAELQQLHEQQIQSQQIITDLNAVLPPWKRNRHNKRSSNGDGGAAIQC